MNKPSIAGSLSELAGKAVAVSIAAAILLPGFALLLGAAVRIFRWSAAL